MSKIDLNDMSSMQYDVLRELGNIGAGNATTALSQMLNAKVDIGVPQVKLLGFDELPTIIGSEEKVMVGILLMLCGDVDGIMMFLMDPHVAKNLVNHLMGGCGMPPSDDENSFNDIERSAIMEIGNIIAGAYLRSLGELTNLTIDVSIPMLQVDMAAAILDVPAIQFGKIGDKVLMIETAFDDEKVGKELDIRGYYILVPELESYDKILSSLGV